MLQSLSCPSHGVVASRSSWSVWSAGETHLRSLERIFQLDRCGFCCVDLFLESLVVSPDGVALTLGVSSTGARTVIICPQPFMLPNCTRPSISPSILSASCSPQSTRSSRQIKTCLAQPCRSKSTAPSTTASRRAVVSSPRVDVTSLS